MRKFPGRVAVRQAGVIGMALHAVGAAQVLMKNNALFIPGNSVSRNGCHPNQLRFMAGDTSLPGRTPERSVAGKAVFSNLLVAADQFSRNNQYMREIDDQDE